MKKLMMTFYRELWEHRAVVIGVPVIVATLALIAAVGIEVAKDRVADGSLAEIIREVSEEEDDLDVIQRKLEEGSSELQMEFDSGVDSDFERIGIFIGFSWLAGFYYLLSCLFADRKDRSILFWKSLPISETFNVFTKLGFGSIGVTLFGIVIGWLLMAVLWLFGLGEIGNGSMSLSLIYQVTVGAVLAVLVGVLWGAPVFAYLAFASAAAKRSPFLLAVVPIPVMSFLEWVFLRDVNIVGFFMSHTPFVVLEHMSSQNQTNSVVQAFLVDGIQGLLQGLVVAALLIFATIWYRNNKFEI
ncbi:MAG: hypothetical protein AAF197_01180 [Pseudomonadota bacterium]